MANRILVLVFLSVIALNVFSQTGDVIQKGQRVPEFTFTTVNGEPVFSVRLQRESDIN